MSTFFLTFFSSFFPQVIHNASKSHAKYAIENQSHRGQPHRKRVDKIASNDSLSHVAGEILEPEGPKSRKRLAYGKKSEKKG